LLDGDAPMQDAFEGGHTMKENALERILRLAADEPAHRPEFCRILLDSKVFVLGESDQPDSTQDGHRTLQAGSHLSLQHWSKADGSTWIPMFTSLEVLSRAIDEQRTYLELPVRSLFETAVGASFVLNPGQPYGKEFVPQEIQALLNAGLTHAPVTRTIEEATQVMIGTPREVPTEMLESLSMLFPKHREVVAAYVALMHDPSRDEKPHLLVAIHVDAEGDLVAREAGLVAAETSPSKDPVDLIVIKDGDDGIAGYFFEEAEPFYKRSAGKN
jgi:hypothetical protein